MENLGLVLYFLFNLLCIIALPWVFASAVSLIYVGIRYFFIVLYSIISNVPKTNKYGYFETAKLLIISIVFVLLGISIGWLGYEYILRPWVTYLAIMDASGK